MKSSHPCLIYYWSPECQNSILEIVVWKSIARNVMRDAWELLDDDFNERPRARPWPCSPHIQHQSLAMRPTLGRDPGKLPGFDIINFWEENCFPLQNIFLFIQFRWTVLPTWFVAKFNTISPTRTKYYVKKHNKGGLLTSGSASEVCTALMRTRPETIFAVSWAPGV